MSKWVYNTTDVFLASDANLSVGEHQYELSNYLPIDNNSYEVMLGINGVSEGKPIVDINTALCRSNRALTIFNGVNCNNVSILVDSSRKININVLTDACKITIRVLAYKKY